MNNEVFEGIAEKINENQIDVFVLIFLFIEALKRQPNFDNDKFKEDVRDFLEKAEFSNEKIKEAVSSRFLE